MKSVGLVAPFLAATAAARFHKRAPAHLHARDIVGVCPNGDICPPIATVAVEVQPVYYSKVIDRPTVTDVFGNGKPITVTNCPQTVIAADYLTTTITRGVVPPASTCGLPLTTGTTTLSATTTAATITSAPIACATPSIGCGIPSGVVTDLPAESFIVLAYTSNPFNQPAKRGEEKRQLPGQTASPISLVDLLPRATASAAANVNAYGVDVVDCDDATPLILDNGALVRFDTSVGKQNTAIDAVLGILINPADNQVNKTFSLNNGVLSWFATDGTSGANFFSCPDGIWAGFPTHNGDGCQQVLVGAIRGDICSSYVASSTPVNPTFTPPTNGPTSAVTTTAASSTSSSVITTTADVTASSSTFSTFTGFQNATSSSTSADDTVNPGTLSSTATSTSTDDASTTGDVSSSSADASSTADVSSSSADASSTSDVSSSSAGASSTADVSSSSADVSSTADVSSSSADVSSTSAQVSSSSATNDATLQTTTATASSTGDAAATSSSVAAASSSSAAAASSSSDVAASSSSSAVAVSSSITSAAASSTASTAAIPTTTATNLVDCILSLPAACADLSTQNGLALLVGAPLCTTALTSVLTTDALADTVDCLNTDSIGLTTQGSGIVTCLLTSGIICGGGPTGVSTSVGPTATPGPLCINSLPGVCTDLVNTNGLALVAPLATCLTALSFNDPVVVTNAQNCLAITPTLTTEGLDVVQCLLDNVVCDGGVVTPPTGTGTTTGAGPTATPNTGCVVDLPGSCTDLAGNSGVALIPGATTCLAEISTNLDSAGVARAASCLAIGNIGAFTDGDDLVTCLENNVLCTDSGTVPTPSTTAATGTATATSTATPTGTTTPQITCLAGLPATCSGLANVAGIVLIAQAPICLTSIAGEGLTGTALTDATQCLDVDISSQGNQVVNCLNIALLCT